jgi:hypothetical protein
MVPALFQQARLTLTKLGWQDYVDVDRLVDAIEQQTGMPVDITAGSLERDSEIDPRRARAPGNQS